MTKQNETWCFLCGNPIQKFLIVSCANTLQEKLPVCRQCLEAIEYGYALANSGDSYEIKNQNEERKQAKGQR